MATINMNKNTKYYYKIYHHYEHTLFIFDAAVLVRWGEGYGKVYVTFNNLIAPYNN